MRVVAYIRTLVAKAQKKNLASYKIATVNAATYLQQLNLQQLTKTKKPNEGQDKREFYQALQKEALEGPIFSLVVIKAIERIVIDLNKDEVKWIANILLKEHQDLYGLSTIVDWSRGTNSKLDKLSFAEAEHKSAEWHSQFHTTVEPAGKYKTKDVIFKLPGGYTIVKITDPDDLVLEGELMQHCVGGYCQQVSSGSSLIFSLRDNFNKPHATIEMRNNGEITQIQGKQNEEPAEKYQEYLIQWLSTLKTTSWLALVNRWSINTVPKYKAIIDGARLKDPSYIMEISLAEGHKAKYEEVILASGSARHIYEYALQYGDRGGDVEKLTKAIARTSDFNYIKIFAVHIPGADIRLLENRLLTAKQEENPNRSLPLTLVKFAEDVPGANIRALEKAVIASGDMEAVMNFAAYIPGADTKELERAIIKSGDPTRAKQFASRVEGADVKELQKVVESSSDTFPLDLYSFAVQVAGADKKSLEKAIINFKGLKDSYYATALYNFAKLPDSAAKALEKALLEAPAIPAVLYKFAKDIEGADINKLATKLIERLSDDSILNLKNNPKAATYITLMAKLPGAPLEGLQSLMLKEAPPWELVEFASNVKGSDIRKLQDRVIELEDLHEIANFANIPGADKDLLAKAWHKIKNRF